jgi:tRNA-binding EMAP/Myf-like protein
VSEFKVEVVTIGEIEKHPNADTLSITNVNGGYPCIIRTGELATGDRAVYVPVDALVPVTRKEFAFLDAGKGRTHERIKARKLRGVFSMGLLIKAPDGARVGDDMRAALGIEKWEPPAEREPEPQHDARRKAKPLELARFELRSWIVAGVGSAAILGSLLLGARFWIVAALLAFIAGVRWLAAMAIRARLKVPNYPVYDIDGLRKFSAVLAEGEPVWITEKIHGCNGSWLHTGKRFWCKSRTLFRGDPENVWRKVAERYGLKDKLAAHPGIVLFGEVYGKVQDLTYGVPPAEGVRMAAFDAMDIKTRRFMDVDAFRDFCREIDVPVVPELYRGPWSDGLNGKSTIADHTREGFVVKPLTERRDNRVGRVILKLAGEDYLLRKGA